MINRRQAITIGILVSTPFLLLIVLLLINPNYEAYIFGSFGLASGMTLLTVLAILHGGILFIAYSQFNMRAAQSEPPPRQHSIILILFLTLFTCSLPSLWIVLLYPSMIILLQTRQP